MLLMTEKEITLTKYIANDGKVFDTEAECIAYEATLDSQNEYTNACDLIKECELKTDKPAFIPLNLFVKYNGNMSDINFTMNRMNFKYYQLKDRNDAIALATVMAHDNDIVITADDILKRSKPLSTFPCIVAISKSYQWGRMIGSFDHDKELLKKFCKKYGYKIKFEKEPDNS